MLGLFVLRAMVPVFLATCSGRCPVLGSIVCAGLLKRSFEKLSGALSSYCFSCLVSGLIGLRVLSFSRFIYF